MLENLGVDEDDDFEDEADDEEEVEIGFLVDLGSERNALIFKEDGGVAVATRSYSSMRFARSSSEVIETSASRSSVGNWQRRLTAVDPHISPIFDNNSVKEMERSTARRRVSPP